MGKQMTTYTYQTIDPPGSIYTIAQSRITYWQAIYTLPRIFI